MSSLFVTETRHVNQCQRVQAIAMMTKVF